MNKPKLLIISKVLPFPGNSGQQIRVKNILESLKGHFHVTFVTSANTWEFKSIKNRLKNIVDDNFILQTEYTGLMKKLYLNVAGIIWALRTGLKMSNYIIGEQDFTRKKLESVIQNRKFDVALYEYWHAYKTLDYFKEKNIPTILDMHNILWKSYQSQIDSKKWLHKIQKRWIVKRYKEHEENIWKRFDGIISINSKENEYIIDKTHKRDVIKYIPMGIDFKKWSIKREFSTPQRIAYYGGLGSKHNQQSALFCYNKVMPLVWDRLNNIELWIIGSNPSKNIKNLSLIDNRVKVTGYVEDIKEILKTISVVLCPWNGTYGFRSRIIEVMALEIPIITTKEAIRGMGLKDSRGIYISEKSTDYSNFSIELLQENKKNISDGMYNRKFSSNLYSLKKTYNRVPDFINSIINKYQNN